MTEISFNTEATAKFVEERFCPKPVQLKRLKDLGRAPDILVVSDLDGSKWGTFTDGLRSAYHSQQNRSNADAFNQYADRFIVADVTGQDIRMTRHLLDVYKPFRHLDFLVNDSGLDLRVNEASLAPSEFLRSMNPAENFDPHPQWDEFINGFFDKQKFNISMHEILTENGFHEVSLRDNDRPAYIYPDCHKLYRSSTHAGIDVSISPGEMSLVTIETRSGHSLEEAELLVRDLSNKLSERIPGVIYQVGMGENFGYAFFTHADQNKQVSKAAIPFAILKLLPESFVNALRAIVCIGDGANDRHLGLLEVARASAEALPVYRLISGRDLYDASPVWLNKAAGRIELAPDRGDIAEALHRVVEQIRW